MKVYFENTGGGMGETSIEVYIKPRKDGSGHQYNSMGNLIEFWWVDPDEALVVDHKLIPTHLWYAFRHGEGTWIMDDKYDFTIENILKYAKCPERTIKQIKAEQKLVNIVLNDEQDIINILHTIDECKYIPYNTLIQIFKIANINEFPIINGELGIASFVNNTKLHTYLEYLRKNSVN